MESEIKDVHTEDDLLVVFAAVSDAMEKVPSATAASADWLSWQLNLPARAWVFGEARSKAQQQPATAERRDKSKHH